MGCKEPIEERYGQITDVEDWLKMLFNYVSDTKDTRLTSVALFTFGKVHMYGKIKLPKEIVEEFVTPITFALNTYEAAKDKKMNETDDNHHEDVREDSDREATLSTNNKTTESNNEKNSQPQTHELAFMKIMNGLTYSLAT